MYYDEHNPPHFHARYGESKVEIAIGTLSVLAGKLPPRAMGLVMEWPVAIKLSLWRTGN
jgi:phosphomannomutase